jgi:hypothetical protein
VWQAAHQNPHTLKEIEVVTEATKKIREIVAFGLLGVVAVLVVNYFALLFKSEPGPLGKETFSTMSALEQGRFVDPVLVGLVVLAVVLVTHLGDVTKSARNITIAALALLGVMVLLGVVTWIAALTANNIDFFVGGALGQGKVTGSIVQLAYLTLAGLAGFFTFTVLSALPAPVKTGAAQPAGWSGYDPGQYAQGQAPGAVPPTWAGQQPPGPGQSWAPPAEQQQWAQPAAQPQWGQPGEQPQWAQPAAQPQWGQPGEQPQWEGQPSEQPQWGQHAEQQQWAQPAEQPQAAPAPQPQWGEPAEQQQWNPPAETEQEWSGTGQHTDLGATQQWTPPVGTDDASAASEAGQPDEEVAEDAAEPQSEPAEQTASQDEDESKEPESPSWWSQPPPE